MSLTSKVVMNASLLAAGRLLMMASGIVTIGISTRYLGPSGYGALATATAFVSILGAVSDLGFTTIGAREIAKRPEETRRLIRSIFTVILLFAGAAACIGFAAMTLIYAGQGNSDTRAGIAIMLLTLLTAAPGCAAAAYFVAKQQAYLTMVASVAGTATSLASLPVIVALDLGFVPMVAAYAAAPVVNAAVMAALLFRRGFRLSPSVDLSLWKQLLRWSLPLAGLALLNGMYARIDTVLLSILASRETAGLYSVAYKAVDILVIFPPYLMITLLPAVAKLDRHSKRLNELTQKAFAAIEVAAVGIFVLVAGFAHEIIKVIAGGGFDQAASVLQILMVGVAVGFAAAVFGNTLVALNQQGRMLRLAPFVLALNVLLNLALIPLWGIYGAAVALTVTEIVGLGTIVYLYRAVGSLPSIHRGPQVILAAGAMAAVVLVKLLPFANGVNPVVILGVLGSLSVAVYMASLYAMRAMPAEVHNGLLLPLWNRLKPR